MFWLDGIVDSSLHAWLGYMGAWHTPVEQEDFRQDIAAYIAYTQTAQHEETQAITRYERERQSMTEKSVSDMTISYWHDKIMIAQDRLTAMTQALSAPVSVPERPGWPGLTITEKQWEAPVRNERGFELGFIDLAVTYQCPILTWQKSPPSADVGWRSWLPSWRQAAPSIGYVYFEVKSKIDSLGELFRQLSVYRPYLKQSWTKRDGDPSLFVVCPDDRFADKIREQGYGFVKYDPRALPPATPAPVALVPTSTAPTVTTVQVEFKKIFFDWDVANGSYTPEQLRKAKRLVKPWGPVKTYACQV
jgi:hypothetical protein